MKNIATSGPLNQSQISLIETFSAMRTEEEANELCRVIRDYYAQKLDAELEKLWNDGSFGAETLSTDSCKK